MGERDHRAACIRAHGDHHVVGHLARQHGPGLAPFLAPFLTRIADRDGEVEVDGDACQAGRELARTDEQQTVARTEHAHQGFTVETRDLLGMGRGQRTATAGQVQPPLDQFARRQTFEQRIERGRRGERLEHQLHGAAAGQAEATRLLRPHAVAYALRPRRHALAAQSRHEVVLDAAAGYRTDRAAVLAQRQQRPGRAWRRTPGAHHRDEHHPPALRQPASCALQHLHVETVHCAPSQALSWSPIGSRRMRLPPAAKSALTSAGASGGTPGSPTPVGFSAEGTMCTSIFGI